MDMSDQRLAFPKGQPRVVDRIQRKQELRAQERACRKAVKARDKGRCVVPGCKERSAHLHHIVYRSRGGKWRSENVCSLCVTHHQMVHASMIRIEGNADSELVITGDVNKLRFKL
jgi:5-methylcytosine-specific restriction endonuclease McrA